MVRQQMNVQLGRIWKDMTSQKRYTILVFSCRGWDKPQTKGLWRRAWDLNRPLLNTWLKCYCYTRLVCVQNIVLHKISIKVTGVACSAQTEVIIIYVHDVQSTNATNWKKLLPTNCTSQNTQGCYYNMCRILRVAIFSGYISQTYSQYWQMTSYLLCEMYSLGMATLNS
jgi:hypothetical protein